MSPERCSTVFNSSSVSSRLRFGLPRRSCATSTRAATSASETATSSFAAAWPSSISLTMTSSSFLRSSAEREERVRSSSSPTWA